MIYLRQTIHMAVRKGGRKKIGGLLQWNKESLKAEGEINALKQ